MKTILFLFCFLALGCSHRVIDFTMISTKNFDVSKKHTKLNNRVTGKDMVPIIIFIPCGSPDIKEAIDKAIEKTPGCVALADGVLYEKFWYIPYIYGQSWYEIEGTPVMIEENEEKWEREPVLKQKGKTETSENVKEIEDGEKKFTIIKKDGHVSIIQKE